MCFAVLRLLWFFVRSFAVLDSHHRKNPTLSLCSLREHRKNLLFHRLQRTVYISTRLIKVCNNKGLVIAHLDIITHVNIAHFDIGYLIIAHLVVENFAI